ncbi:mitochondrial pyruvate carrier [Plakobranchus ocellatus]|uniref:Mitochondrial pyruvate carrier n=1 Tax=Plakobranchus ocellatus TaxID=259542 RepID=A0AAV3XZ27_9GAST|nr:mitochondrial pyruvate carrier [Plakobranchus ocellatus]
MIILSSVYRALVAVGDRHVPTKFRALWEHPAGPKTIHFWAPGAKWALVIAGLGDLSRPAEKLSVYQSTALAATGAIWARYSLVIIPKNYSLFTVNVFVFITGATQLSRALYYRYTKGKSQATPAVEASKTSA